MAGRRIAWIWEARDSDAAQGNTQDMDATLANLQGRNARVAARPEGRPAPPHLFGGWLRPVEYFYFGWLYRNQAARSNKNKLTNEAYAASPQSAPLRLKSQMPDGCQLIGSDSERAAESDCNYTCILFSCLEHSLLPRFELEDDVKAHFCYSTNLTRRQNATEGSYPFIWTSEIESHTIECVQAHSGCPRAFPSSHWPEVSRVLGSVTQYHARMRESSAAPGNSKDSDKNSPQEVVLGLPKCSKADDHLGAALLKTQLFRKEW